MRSDTGMANRNIILTAGVINVILGIWLIISPWLLGYVSTQAYWNGVILGVAIGIIALIRLLGPRGAVWLSWINVILGIWLIISPFVLRVESAAAHWNSVIVGIIVAIVAWWSAAATRQTTPPLAP